MRPLIDIRLDLHAALERLCSLKTKAAKAKQVYKLQTLRCEAFESMNEVFHDGDLITLDHQVNCSNTFSGGGWGIKGAVKVMHVGSTSLQVACGDEVFDIEVLEDWKRWGSDSFWAFESFLKSRGQDIGFAAREHTIKSISRHLKGALSCRHSLDVVNHKPLRQSKHYMQRIQAMLGELRNLKAQQIGGSNV